MARELVTKNIDGKSYEFQQFNPTQSLKMLARLTKLVGEPLLLTLASSGKPKKKGTKGGLFDDADHDLLAKGIKELVLRMGDDDEVISIVKQLSSQGVLCDHKQVDFDLHFDGGEGLAHLFRVVRAALEVQYGNFIGALIASVGISRTIS